MRLFLPIAFHAVIIIIDIYIYCCYICNQGCQRSEIVQEQGESGEMIQLYILHLYSY